MAHIKSNSQLSELFRNVAAAYLIKKVDRFRMIAYEKAADSIEQQAEPVYELWQKKQLDTVPGLGKTLKGNLNELFMTGASSVIDEALSGIPPAVFELMKVPGLGPLKAYKLAHHFGIIEKDTAATELLKHAENGEVAVLEGFGRTSESALKEGIALYQRTRAMPARIPFATAKPIADKITSYISADKRVLRVDVMGSLRRREATIGDIDIAVAVKQGDEEEVLKYIIGYPGKESIINAGATKVSLRVAPNLRVDIRVQHIESYGTMLQYFTGSKAHNILLREHALKQGYSLNEYGLKPLRDNGKMLKVFASEEELYRFLGMNYISPELRKGTDEIDQAIHQLRGRTKRVPG